MDTSKGRGVGVVKLYFAIIKSGSGYWVMAEDEESAYKKLREILDEKGLYNISERELRHIDVIGEELGESENVYREVDQI